MADFTVREGDAFSIADTLKDADGNPADIAAASIRFTLIPLGGGAAILNDVAAVNDQVGNGSDGSKGKVHYTSTAIGALVPGLYLGSWRNATSGQTFPNGGYILFEVTADTPVAAATRFADSIDLEARLGLTFSADEHIRAAKLLADASGLIQDETGQTIALVTADSLSMPSDYSNRIRLPQRPVNAVTSVTLDGVALPGPIEWYVDGDELVRTNWLSLAERHFSISAGGWGGPLRTITVVYNHGFATIPRLVKDVCLEAVVRVWVNPGAVIQETNGNTSTMYSMRSGTETPTGLLLTDAEKKQLRDLLRRESGSIALR